MSVKTRTAWINSRIHDRYRQIPPQPHHHLMSVQGLTGWCRLRPEPSPWTAEEGERGKATGPEVYTHPCQTPEASTLQDEVRIRCYAQDDGCATRWQMQVVHLQPGLRPGPHVFDGARAAPWLLTVQRESPSGTPSGCVPGWSPMIHRAGSRDSPETRRTPGGQAPGVLLVTANSVRATPAGLLPHARSAPWRTRCPPRWSAPRSPAARRCGSCRPR